MKRSFSAAKNVKGGTEIIAIINNIMLKKIRIALAVVFFILITMLFLDFTGSLHRWLSWTAKVQFLPAILSLNLLVVALLLVVTLVFGRIYCSVICPLGVMQDVFSFFGKRGKRNPYKYKKERRWLRYGVLAVFIIALCLGLNAFTVLISPYSAYGRIAANILKPLYILGNNALAYFAERLDSYAFYSVDVWVKSLASLAVALLTLLVLGVLAWRGGRTYCNNICPVGTILGMLSRVSLLKIRIAEDKCISCGRCGRYCKASCIDSKNHTIDYSRCVVCGDCMGQCHEKALVYGLPKLGLNEGGTPSIENKSRRAFLLGTAIAATAALFAQDKKKVDGGLALIEDKTAPPRNTPVHPAGSISARHLQQHCTACQLCIAECPNDVLRPSTDLKTFMQPEMSYEKGYCHTDCNRCSTVCPAGAILPVTPEEKVSTQIGHAVWIRKNCVVIADKQQCYMCSSVCPAGAISLVPLDKYDEESLKVPAVDAAKCIGCGACENMCPSRPLSAIYVEGHEVHKLL